MAISPSSYAVGNRLYKGATSAPTRGRVDPTGYIDRELNKVASRSGIASAALRKMSGGNDPNAFRYGSQGQQATPQSITGQSGQVKAIGGGGGFGASQTPLGGALRVSPVGKLQAPQLKDPTALPFDPEKADAEEQLMFQKNKFEQQFTRGQQDLERQYTVGKRDLENERPNNERRLLENYAGRGMAYSSGYAHDVGALQGQYANQAAELEGGRASSLADLLRQRAEFNDEYGMNMGQIQKAAARRAAEQAKELELENARLMSEHQAALEAERARLFPVDAPLSAEQIATNNNYVPPAGSIPNYGPVNPYMPTPAGQQQWWSGGGGLDAFGNKNAPAPTPAPAPAPANPKYHQTVSQKAAPAPAPVPSYVKNASKPQQAQTYFGKRR